MNEAIAGFAVSLYIMLIPLAWIGLIVVLLVLLPMAAFRATRGPAVTGLLLASWLFALTTWTLGAAVTFGTLGWFWLLVGLVFFGIGVIPIGILTAFFILKLPSVGITLIIMAGIVWICRLGAIALAQRTDEE